MLVVVALSALAQQNFTVTAGTNSTVVLPERNLKVGRVPVWTKSTAYTAGTYFMTAAQQFYLVRTGGTSGTNAPTAEETVTNGTVVAEFVPFGPRSGFAIVNAGTNIVDLTIGGGVGGVRLWPRGSWSDGGPSCPQAEIRASADGSSELRGCEW
jgi:hypothetical protein